MPYAATRRSYNEFGKKVSRSALYRKAKKLYATITRDMAALESRFLKSRQTHA